MVLLLKIASRYRNRKAAANPWGLVRAVSFWLRYDLRSNYYKLQYSTKKSNYVEVLEDDVLCCVKLVRASAIICSKNCHRNT